MFLLKTADNVSRGGVGSSGSSSSNPLSNIQPGAIAVVAIIAFIIAIILLVVVIERKKAPRGKFLKWLREYLNFRSILISGIIKFVYTFLAVFLTIMSVVVMCQGRDEMVLPMIGIGLAIMVFGNVLLRIMMEMTMAVIVIWENTSDIRGVLVKKDETPEENEPKESKESKKKDSESRVDETAVEQEQAEVVQPAEVRAEAVQVAEVVQPVEVVKATEVKQAAEAVQPDVAQAATGQSDAPKTL